MDGQKACSHMNGDGTDGMLNLYVMLPSSVISSLVNVLGRVLVFAGNRCKVYTRMLGT